MTMPFANDERFVNRDAAYALAKTFRHDLSLWQWVMGALMEANVFRLMKGDAPAAPFDLFFLTWTMHALHARKYAVLRVLSEDMQGWLGSALVGARVPVRILEGFRSWCLQDDPPHIEEPTESGDGAKALPWMEEEAARVLLEELQGNTSARFVTQGLSAAKELHRQGATISAPFDLRYFVKVLTELSRDRRVVLSTLLGEDLRWWSDDDEDPSEPPAVVTVQDEGGPSCWVNYEATLQFIEAFDFAPVGLWVAQGLAEAVWFRPMQREAPSAPFDLLFFAKTLEALHVQRRSDARPIAKGLAFVRARWRAHEVGPWLNESAALQHVRSLGDAKAERFVMWGVDVCRRGAPPSVPFDLLHYVKTLGALYAERLNGHPMHEIFVND
ncbi:hypothetical protein [Corallococcus terminator]|uniref:Uncharacterized protein n=1 Tax=Corallococcus terminator TaxID=2316733 RepID=A0A3A8IYL8_9BACT|nr:hypothetical protein [Corallococcus terminator]RKG88315.1 hypothetical protein D7V88_14395 [Corallococcus terminator]